MTLNDSNYKLCYGIHVNGQSRRFMLLVAEFAPCCSQQCFESDFIKVGKEMRTVLNELFYGMVCLIQSFAVSCQPSFSSDLFGTRTLPLVAAQLQQLKLI
ncbi:uncharacterized protein BYT42DRAFT_341763 [Radiomyces spectabilis]|uniref:uncharacterized protein n=1 Tax=Radiomyces spectabilis TaxID=64574 RepID=UPI0022206CF2|nr:uncharacterized protein BYT42DRAFT_341763 [Radiomyces spectabilis]KAI8377384.1 hypothetical protein BYT42DRAFT_341763 [Radiomyces spectabilis]